MSHLFNPLYGRLLRPLQFPRKLGLCGRLFGRALAGRGVTWVDLGGIAWKLNLANPTHRWMVFGEYEDPRLRGLLRNILASGGDVVDSGANIGQMVVMYRRHGPAARVFAFEPTPAAREWLEEGVARNALGERVRVMPLALGAEAGVARLAQLPFGHKEGAQNHLVAGEEGLAVKVVRLDDVASEEGISRVRFWKLDTEGHELPAMLGARSLLREGRVDYLYAETANAGAEILSLLAGFGYIAVDLDRRRRVPAAEVRAEFTNLFVSEQVARDECSL